jgi:kynurenine 3-monooxygenase
LSKRWSAWFVSKRSGEITLVGAGLAGSLLGVFLARRGFPVVIFERRPDLRRVDISAGRSINLALANRGIHALGQVGLMPKIEPLLIPMRGRMLHDEQGNLQLLPYGNKPQEVIYSISRGALNALLMDAAEQTGKVQIRFEQACTGVELNRRSLQVNSEAIPYEVLIGTDGSASLVRDAIVAASGGESHEEPLGHSYKELTIPPGEARRFGMERNALHIWPRGEFMLIALPNTDGSFTATLFLPNEGEESFGAITDSAAVHQLFERRFADALRLMPNLDEQFFSNPTGRLSTIRCWPWHFGDHALILGDAAHAIVPFHGQGMNAAFEDCSALDACLGSYGQNWRRIFESFARERKPSADAIADMALENYVEMRSSVRDPKFQLKKELSFRLEERHPDRFIPRYSMVMFHLIPYAEAQRRGALQEGILEDLVANASSINEIDLPRADRLIKDRLEPLPSDLPRS